MNCKKCGFPLNGNQTCPNCGEINEINNVVNNEVPQEVPTSAPVVAPVTSLTPVEPVNNVVEKKKKNNGLVIVLVIVGLLVIGTGVFLGVRTLGNKPSNSTSNNTNVNNTNGEKEEKNPDAAIVKNQVFIAFNPDKIGLKSFEYSIRLENKVNLRLLSTILQSSKFFLTTFSGFSKVL